MAKNKDSASYGIIGLGRFGTALAKSLAAAGKDVMIIDSSEAKVRELRQYTEQLHLFAHDLGRETRRSRHSNATPSSYVSVKKSTPASSPRSMS